MAVYIANEIVMTKNSAGVLSPFVVMRFQCCVDNFIWSANLTVRGFRSREQCTPNGGSCGDQCVESERRWKRPSIDAQ